MAKSPLSNPGVSMENDKNTTIYLPSQMLTDGTKLCLECGLCCTGIFHERALIYTKIDKEYAEGFNADIILHDGKECFKLPCPIYEGKCPIYPYNPSVCQKYECNLLKKVNDHHIDLEKAITVVNEMKQIIEKINYNFESLSFKMDTKQITVLFKHFFSSIPNSKRKDFSSLLKEYTAFLYLEKKYFHE